MKITTIAFLCGLGLFAGFSRAAVFVVNNGRITPDTNPGDGLCLDSQGGCNLNAAVMESEALPGQDTISIGIPKWSTLLLAYTLTDSVIIDGNNLDFTNLAFTIHNNSVVRNMRLQESLSYLNVLGSHNTINNLKCPMLFIKGNQNTVQDMICTNLPGYLTGTNNSFTACWLGGFDNGQGDWNQFGNCRLTGGASLYGNDNRFQALTALPWSYLRFFGDRNQVLNSQFTNAYLRLDGTNNLASGTKLRPGNISLYNGRGNTITGCDIWGNPPQYGTGLSGIYIENSRENIIGGDTEGEGNVIGGHDRNGIFITGAAASGNSILGNKIGVDAVGTKAATNGDDGVSINNAPFNTVGGISDEERNIISGNKGCGILVFGSTAISNKIYNNYIGLDITGSRAIPNQESGIRILNAPGTLIGSDNYGANTVSGNKQKGMYISGNETQVRGNFIGLDPEMEAAFPNGEEGVYIYGDRTVVNLNQIAGNAGNGIYLQGNKTKVTACTIGYKTEAGLLIGNGGHGIEMSGSNNDIDNNSVLLNAGDGINLSGSGSTNNVLRNNFIGISGAESDLGNGGDGICIDDAPRNIIGAQSGHSENSIGYNRGAGIGLYFGADNTLIHGNYIGTDLSRTNCHPNVDSGILIARCSGVTVVSNEIVFNGVAGIELTAQADNNRIIGNFIGISPAVGEDAPLGNVGPGIIIRDSSYNHIGPPRGVNSQERNWITYNEGPGVQMIYSNGPACAGNGIFDNVISGNEGLGIDLGNNGVTLNDAGDNDSGPNHYQNFPVITSIAADGYSANFTLSARPNTAYFVEFFMDWECDASGYGEGNFHLGSVTVTTDGGGHASGNCAFSRIVTADQFAMATATDPQDNTSEFSACYPEGGGGLWAGASNLGGGWKYLGWFGYFSDSGNGWIYHNEHKWMYAQGQSQSSIWFWTSDMGWLWTTSTAYPSFYRVQDNAWIWYLKDSVNPRWFYNMKPGHTGWESH